MATQPRLRSGAAVSVVPRPPPGSGSVSAGADAAADDDHVEQEAHGCCRLPWSRAAHAAGVLVVLAAAAVATVAAAGGGRATVGGELAVGAGTIVSAARLLHVPAAAWPSPLGAVHEVPVAVAAPAAYAYLRGAAPVGLRDAWAPSLPCGAGAGAAYRAPAVGAATSAVTLCPLRQLPRDALLCDMLATVLPAVTLVAGPPTDAVVARALAAARGRSVRWWEWEYAPPRSSGSNSSAAVRGGVDIVARRLSSRGSAAAAAPQEWRWEAPAGVLPYAPPRAAVLRAAARNVSAVAAFLVVVDAARLLVPPPTAPDDALGALRALAGRAATLRATYDIAYFVPADGRGDVTAHRLRDVLAPPAETAVWPLVWPPPHRAATAAIARRVAAYDSVLCHAPACDTTVGLLARAAAVPVAALQVPLPTLFLAGQLPPSQGATSRLRPGATLFGDGHAPPPPPIALAPRHTARAAGDARLAPLVLPPLLYAVHGHQATAATFAAAMDAVAEWDAMYHRSRAKLRAAHCVRRAAATTAGDADAVAAAAAAAAGGVVAFVVTALPGAGGARQRHGAPGLAAASVLMERAAAGVVSHLVVPPDVSLTCADAAAWVAATAPRLSLPPSAAARLLHVVCAADLAAHAALRDAVDVPQPPHGVGADDELAAGGVTATALAVLYDVAGFDAAEVPATHAAAAVMLRRRLAATLRLAAHERVFDSDHTEADADVQEAPWFPLLVRVDDEPTEGDTDAADGADAADGDGAAAAVRLHMAAVAVIGADAVLVHAAPTLPHPVVHGYALDSDRVLRAPPALAQVEALLQPPPHGSSACSHPLPPVPPCAGDAADAGGACAAVLIVGDADDALLLPLHDVVRVLRAAERAVNVTYSHLPAAAVEYCLHAALDASQPVLAVVARLPPAARYPPLYTLAARRVPLVVDGGAPTFIDGYVYDAAAPATVAHAVATAVHDMIATERGARGRAAATFATFDDALHAYTLVASGACAGGDALHAAPAPLPLAALAALQVDVGRRAAARTCTPARAGAHG